MNSKYFHCIVEYYDKLNQKHISAGQIYNLCVNLPNIKDFSFILHDKDTRKNDVLEEERPHYHINLIFDNNGYEEHTILTQIAKSLECNINCIGVKATNGKEMLNWVLYLLHKNHPMKYQYDEQEIYAYNYDNVDKCLCGLNPYMLSIEYLCELIDRSKTLVAVYNDLGLKISNQYYKIITSLWLERKGKSKE